MERDRPPAAALAEAAAVRTSPRPLDRSPLAISASSMESRRSFTRPAVAAATPAVPVSAFDTMSPVATTASRFMSRNRSAASMASWIPATYFVA